MNTFGHFDDQHREYVMPVATTSTRMPSSAASRVTVTTVYPWMPVAATSISRMARPYGIQAGSLARPTLTAMSAVTA